MGETFGNIEMQVFVINCTKLVFVFECGNPQQQAICVFAYLKKKYIPKNEFINTYRGFFIKGGRSERICTDRDGEHIFNEVYERDSDQVYNEGDMVWREDIDLVILRQLSQFKNREFFVFFFESLKHSEQ